MTWEGPAPFLGASKLLCVGSVLALSSFTNSGYTSLRALNFGTFRTLEYFAGRLHVMNTGLTCRHVLISRTECEVDESI